MEIITESAGLHVRDDGERGVQILALFFAFHSGDRIQKDSF